MFIFGKNPTQNRTKSLKYANFLVIEVVCKLIWSRKFTFFTPFVPPRTMFHDRLFWGGKRKIHA